MAFCSRDGYRRAHVGNVTLSTHLFRTTGFDIYSRAVSDVYQDLYGEGIFTGKGIYDVDALRTVLERRFRAMRS